MTHRVLIVGLGMAGMASAIALKQKGWTPIIVEKSAERRTGGYFIGLHGAGKDAAEKLGILDKIHGRTPTQSQNWDVLGDGSRIRVAGFADQVTQPTVLLRGDIEAGLWKGVENQVEVRFGTRPTSIENVADGVIVKLKHEVDGQVTETEEKFDLVVGADGLRSSVREMVFGPHEYFMQSLGTMICAYQLKDEITNFPQHDGIILCEENRSLWVFPLEDHTPTALFTYRTDDIDAQFKDSPVETLRKVYTGMDQMNIISEALGDLEQSKDYLFDSVHTVKMKKWSKGRVVLVGDAAWCLTLYSGMGATAGIKGGYELACALEKNDDIEAALSEWEKGMRPFTRKYQITVPLKSQVFVPSNGFASVLRRVALRVAGRKLFNKNKAGKASA